jgi:monofunctional biosynthetic peptidoglycan transglycosylase
MNQTDISPTPPFIPNVRKKKKTGILGWIGKIIISLLAFSVLWVLLYMIVPAPFTSLMVQRALEGDKIRYYPVSLTKINRNLVDSVIASEDARFCQHYGFELEAMQKAFKANQRGKKLRGASTISQQTSKNLFLWSSRSYIRKGFEAGFTILTETIWTKRRIMEMYLNVAEMGNGVFGAEAASLYYFNKHAKDLTPYEAARIAAILPNPQKYRVNAPGPYVQRRANAISRGANTVRNSGLDSCIYK